MSVKGGSTVNTKLLSALAMSAIVYKDIRSTTNQHGTKLPFLIASPMDTRLFLHVHIRINALRYLYSITIVQSYTGKYHKLVAICIVTSVQHK